MDNKYLQDLYKEGFVPGPKEDIKSFEKRVALIKDLIPSPEAFLKKLEISYDEILPITPYFLSITKKKPLPFWFGAMTWIYEHEGCKIPILELPKQTRGLGLTKMDIISHEHIHFLRAAFSEPKFEEVLAYQTSNSWWRRYFGPFFRRPSESYFFLAFCIAVPFFPLLALAFFIPLFRLFIYQWLFARALKNLSKSYKNALELLTLFTDKEILQTAFSKPVFPTSPRSDLINQIKLSK